MGTISLRRLSDATIKRYEQLEADGKLTERQRKAWDSHKAMCRFSAARENGHDFHGSLARAVAPNVFRNDGTENALSETTAEDG